MKLILCTVCLDVYKLSSREKKSCMCGNTWGQYLSDGLKAEVSDTPDTVVLGFVNQSLREAILTKRAEGDLPDGTGHRFIAFLMPDDAPNIKRIKDKIPDYNEDSHD